MSGGEPGTWHATHIFYSADPRPMLAECVAPLVADLRARGLLERYFFINYWLEGPHVRLRLKPASQDSTAEVCGAAEEAIDDFLARRPALYEVDPDYQAFSRDMFRHEYSDRQWTQQYGESETMPMRPNNSRCYLPYEPEYGKYGGEDGIELAEWHFEHSSDLVLDLVRRTNVHVRTVMLGIAAQLMMVMTATFLDDRDTMVEFLERYHGFWKHAFELGDPDREERHDRNYDAVAADLCRRVDEITGAIGSPHPEQLTTFSRRWAAHCAQLRERVSTLAGQGRLLFPSRDGYGSSEPVRRTDPATALRTLLLPYLHMTNNRLGVTIMDEAYLSFLLFRALREDRLAGVGGTR